MTNVTWSMTFSAGWNRFPEAHIDVAFHWQTLMFPCWHTHAMPDAFKSWLMFPTIFQLCSPNVHKPWLMFLDVERSKFSKLMQTSHYRCVQASIDAAFHWLTFLARCVHVMFDAWRPWLMQPTIGWHFLDDACRLRLTFFQSIRTCHGCCVQAFVDVVYYWLMSPGWCR